MLIQFPYFTSACLAARVILTALLRARVRDEGRELEELRVLAERAGDHAAEARERLRRRMSSSFSKMKNSGNNFISGTSGIVRKI